MARHRLPPRMRPVMQGVRELYAMRGSDAYQNGELADAGADVAFDVDTAVRGQVARKKIPRSLLARMHDMARQELELEQSQTIYEFDSNHVYSGLAAAFERLHSEPGVLQPVQALHQIEI